MATGDKKRILMEADKGAPGGVAGLDANGKIQLENLNVEYIKNINPTTTGYSTLLGYMAARYNEHPVVFGYATAFSDLPSGVSGQAMINLCGGVLTATLFALGDVWYRSTNSLSTWHHDWRKVSWNG